MSLLRATFLVCLLCMATGLHGQQRVLDRIVAIVDREIITESELNSQVDFFVFNNRVDPQTPNLKRDVLDAMINEKLILAKAVEDTVTVADEEVTQQLEGLIQQRVQQAGSEPRLEEMYGMPISRMKLEFRDEMRKQMLIGRLQQSRFSDLQVSRREVEEFYAAYRDSLPRVPEELELYHIFRVPKASSEAKAAVRAKAEKILDSLKAGGDFSDFAKRYSEDPGSAAAGGDLQFIRRGQLVREFEEAVFGLKGGQLSDIVETSFGFHIVLLVERRGEAVHAKHILFKIPRDETMERSATDFLNGLRDSVAAGASFFDLAKRYSEDVESGPIGGSLGTFTIDQLADPELSSALTSLQQGEISKPIRASYGTTYGYHIVYLKKRTPEHAMNLRGDWRRIEQIALNFKRNTEYQKWISELRKDIYWDIKL
jgi:peptidyl-prolyl cis-trans isomerase SurA